MEHTNVIIKHSDLKEDRKQEAFTLLTDLLDRLSREEFYITFQSYAILEIDKFILELKESSRTEIVSNTEPINKYDIFFSYSTDDEKLANELYETLSASGLKCFLAEKNIRASEIWEARIRDALRSSNLVLLLITPNSFDKPWVLVEAGAAWCLNKSVLPLLRYVKPEKLIDPIRKHQARLIEASSQIEDLVNELLSGELITSANIK